jgi:2-succinyl-5-enolpyruvyl-6-hydroxy-3-cyclohexene-1-carboxylate synthase
MSTAFGIAAGSDEPVVLVLGDLSFYHDMNGLLAAKRHALNLTIVLVHNDGGGIFSFLPQANYPEHFELLFGTPHGLNFQPAVEMYGGVFERIEDWARFRTAVERGITSGGLHVIEVPTNRERNVALHRGLWPAVGARLRACFGDDPL